MSPEAQDLITKLLIQDPTKRLGAKGVEEIKSHPFFDGLNWENLYNEPRHGTFVPKPTDKMDTGYFFARERPEGDSFVSGFVHQEER